MDPSTYSRIQEIVDRALELPAGEREAHARERCGDDGALLARVLELLALVLEEDGAFSEDGLESRREALDEVLAGQARDAGWHPERIGPYAVEGVIGRGGMGVVLRARQQSPDRHVAIKLLNPAFATAETVERLRREAEILGGLSHPGIAQIFEASSVDFGFGDQPFLVMEAIEGEPIVQYAASRELDLQGAARLIIEVCDAVQHAHERGVVHRDLKPDNILVDGRGQPKLLDFGIAGTRDLAAAEARLTVEGQILGTMAYMPPEQASRGADPIGPAADVFSIGAVLYELVAKRPPRQVDGLPITDVLRELSEAQVPGLRTVDRRVPRDLETIVARALEGRPRDRYPSAAALATDLRRFLEARPISARPAGPVNRAFKFARRNRLPVAGAAAVVLGLGAALAVTVAQNRRVRRAEARAQVERYAAEMLVASARITDPVTRGRTARSVERWAPDAPLGRRIDELAGHRWEWHLLASVNRDGMRALELDGAPTALALSPDGARAAVGMGAEIALVSVPSGEVLDSFSPPGETVPDLISGLAWSADGDALAIAGSGAVGVWDLGSGTPVRRWSSEVRYYASIRWGAGGARVHVVDRTLLTLDARTGERLSESDDAFMPINDFGVHPESGHVLIAGRGGGLAWIDPGDGSVVRRLAPSVPWSTSLALSPDLTRVAVGSIEGEVALVDAVTGEVLSAGQPHPERVFDVAWRPDGLEVATVSEDGTLRTFDGRTGEGRGVFNGHSGSPRRVTYTRDGDRILSTAWAAEALLWDPAEADAVRRWRVRGFEVIDVQGRLGVDPGGDTLIVSNRFRAIGMDLQDAEERFALELGSVVSVHPQGGELAYAPAGHTVVVRRAPTAAERSVEIGRDTHMGLDWLPGPERRLVAGNAGGTYLIEVPGAAEEPLVATRLGDVVGQVMGLDCAHHSQRAALLLSTQRVRIVDLDLGSGDVEFALPEADPLGPLAWSPSDDRLAVAGYDGGTAIVDAATWEQRRLLEGHAGPVLCVAWHPGGGRLATGGRDGTVKLWDPRTGLLVASLEMGEPVLDVLWIEDGGTLASLDRGGDVTLWDASRSLRRVRR